MGKNKFIQQLALNSKDAGHSGYINMADMGLVHKELGVLYTESDRYTNTHKTRKWSCAFRGV